MTHENKQEIYSKLIITFVVGTEHLAKTKVWELRKLNQRLNKKLNKPSFMYH